LSRRRHIGNSLATVPIEPAPFDVVEASRRVWLDRWNPTAASGMAVFTAILRSQQLLSNEIATVMRQHDLTFARYGCSPGWRPIQSRHSR